MNPFLLLCNYEEFVYTFNQRFQSVNMMETGAGMTN